MKIEEFKKRLRIRFTYQGERKCLSLGLAATATNRIEAEKVLLKIQSDIERGLFDVSLEKYRLQSGQAKPLFTTLKLIGEEWLKVSKNNVDDKTLNWYKGAFKRIEGLEINSINYAVILSALSGLGSETAKRYLKIYQDVWLWGIEHQLIERSDNPLKGIKLGQKRRSKRPEPFNSKEIRGILEGFNKFYPEYKPLIIFLLETGCRPGEALGLKWSDFSQDLTLVAIERQLTRGELKAPKMGKTRRYKLSLSTTALLSTLPKNKAFVFHDGNWDDRGIYSRWKKVLESENIKYRRPYNTRHTFVSHCLANGANLYEVAQVTGHDPTVLLNNYAGMLNEPTAPGLNY